MSAGAVSYTAIVGLVAQGHLVAFAAGSLDGELACAWIACPLAGSPSAEFAYDRDDRVRVAQMIGALSAVRDNFRPHGFIPA